MANVDINILFYEETNLILFLKKGKGKKHSHSTKNIIYNQNA